MQPGWVHGGRRDNETRNTSGLQVLVNQRACKRVNLIRDTDKNDGKLETPAWSL